MSGSSAAPSRSSLGALLVAFVLLASGCASDERPFLLPPDAVGALESSTTTTTETLPPTTVARVPKALITPTGVVAPILAQGEDSYLIQTPCQAEVELVYGTPLYEVDVVLDPGHGGDVETGAVGPNGLVEKDLNLRLAKRAARKLEARGITVALTRTADYRLPIRTRAQIADTLDAVALVSVHHNAPVLSSSSGPGTEVFYQSASGESARLAGLLQEEIVTALEQFEDVDWVSAADAGVVSVLRPDGSESYGMIRRPATTAVLAEFGYLANASEAELFATDEYLEAAAGALAGAVQRFLETEESGVAPNAEPRTFTPTVGTGGVNGCTDPPLE